MKDTPLYPDMRKSTGKMTIHLMDFGISQILISRVWYGNLAEGAYTWKPCKVLNPQVKANATPDPPPTTSLELPIELLQRYNWYNQLQYPNIWWYQGPNVLRLPGLRVSRLRSQSRCVLNHSGAFSGVLSTALCRRRFHSKNVKFQEKFRTSLVPLS